MVLDAMAPAGEEWEIELVLEFKTISASKKRPREISDAFFKIVLLPEDSVLFFSVLCVMHKKKTHK